MHLPQAVLGEFFEVWLISGKAALLFYCPWEWEFSFLCFGLWDVWQVKSNVYMYCSDEINPVFMDFVNLKIKKYTTLLQESSNSHFLWKIFAFI